MAATSDGEQARRIATTLRAHRAELLDYWIALAKADVEGVPRARELDREGLVDFVPGLIDDLCDALDSIDPAKSPTVAARDHNTLGAAIRHAEHRFTQGYTITEVLRELGHFRVAVLQLCSAQQTPLIGPAGRLVHALIDRAIEGGAETIERREHAQIESDKTRAIEVARAKDDFISLVSHELRVPLNAILGWCQLARSRRSQASIVSRALETIERNAVLQGRLIDDLLDLARMRRKKLKVDLRSLDPLAPVSAAVDDIGPAALAKHVSVALTTQPDMPPVAGDFDRLHQIFSNLLANALKFTPEGGRIEVEATRRGRCVRVAVRDTGLGIAPELLAEIFDPFRQGDPGAGKRKGGVGLGLALVRELAELHGGRAFAESPGVGRGATFVVEIPALPAASLSPAA